jgi:methyl-accepting chemotaxis protein
MGSFGRAINDLRIGHKLYLGFGAVLVVLAVIVVVALKAVGQINDSAEEKFVNDAIPLKALTTDILTQMVNEETGVRGYLVTGDKSSLDPYYAGREKVAENLKAAAPYLEKHPIMKGLVEDAKPQIDGLHKYFESQIALVAKGPAGKAEAQAKIGGGKELFDAFRAQSEKITADTNKFVKDAETEQDAQYTSARNKLILFGIAAFLLAVLAAWLLQRAIARPLGKVVSALDEISEGSLDTELEHQSKDEVGQVAASYGRMREYLQGIGGAADRVADGDLTVEVTPKSNRDVLGNAFSTMIANLREIVGNVGVATGQVASASQQMASTSEEAGKAVGEIASAVSEVAQGAERQVRGVESVKGSADDAASAARDSATQAQEAAEVAKQAQDAATEGVGAAAQATEAMRAVSASSESVTTAIRELAGKSDEIGAIVETITGIAGQTNLLALNAAIEAARAGEQGRGFAVVAEEVRKLAEESQQAAEQISELIAQIQGDTQNVVGVVEDSAQQTEEGAATVGQTRDAFERIGTAVEDVTARITQIAGAAQQISAETAKMQGEIAEVASVAEQSSASAEEVSASTEETSASTQEIAASAQELATTAEGLERLVSRFKLNA